MNKRKFQVGIMIVLFTLLISTVAYAYVGPSLGSRTLQIGMVGGDVQDLQNVLNGKGYQVGYADGIFGWKTKTGVTNFQASKGLVADGIVGPVTLKALQNSGGSTKYTVQAGDSLYLIASKFGVTTNQLKQANRLNSDVIQTGQVLTIPKGGSAGGGTNTSTTPLATILKQKGISSPIPNLRIVVNKSAHLLTLFSGSTALKSYHIALGDNGLGDKQKAGDHKTPEGQFYIAERSVLSPTDQYLGTRWMRVSYPNIEDAQRGLNSGLIDQATYQQIVNAINNKRIPPQNTALGGGVGIHGGDGMPGNSGNTWTYGCMALNNSNVNEIYDYIAVGTPLTINP